MTPIQELDQNHPAVQYLLDRQFDPVEMGIRWGISYCPGATDVRPAFTDRIVIPLFHACPRSKLAQDSGPPDVILAGWQARVIDEISADGPKYLSSEGLPKSKLLYGLPEAIGTSGPIIVCEGVTDVWRIGPGAVALLGKTISPQQVRLLKRVCGNRPVVILLDRDCLAEAREIRRRLGGSTSGRRIALAQLPGSHDDPGDCRPEEVRFCVADALGISASELRMSPPYDVVDARRKKSRRFNQLGRQRIGGSVAVAYVVEDGYTVGMCLAGSDGRLRYFVGGGFDSIVKSIQSVHRLYADAVSARLAERSAEIPAPRSFDDLRIADQLMRNACADDGTDTGQDRTSETIFNAALPMVNDTLHQAAAIRSRWDDEATIQRLHEADMNYVYSEIELPVIEPTVAMMEAGIRVDVDRLQKQRNSWKHSAKQLRRQINKAVGRSINLDDPEQLASWLYDEAGLPVLRTTRSGRPATDQHALELLSEHHEVPGLIRERRRQEHLISSIRQLLPQVRPETGRAHCHLDPLGAETGRFSCRSPALQSMPSDLRDAFVADEGCLLIEADYSQIELRVLAALSGDAGLLRTFREGRDPHCRTASLVLGTPEEDLSSDARDVGKRVNYAIIYGMTPRGLADDLGISREQAADFIEDLLDGYPGVRDWIRRVHADAAAHGCVRSFHGRVRAIPALGSSDQRSRRRGQRQAVNSIIQMTAADVLKLALASIHERLPENCRLLLTVHDSVLIQAPSSEIQRTVRIVMECMETQFAESPLPLRVDLGVGRSWGTLRRYRRGASMPRRNI